MHVLVLYCLQAGLKQLKDYAASLRGMN